MPLPPYGFLEKLKTEPSVEALYLFGSRARGMNRPRSDIDLAILCPEATAADWSRIVDIIEDADTLLEIDIVRLDAESADSRLRDEIERDKEVLFERRSS